MIEARELSKSYGSTRAVDGLTFDVVAGRVTGFLGPNGAGKSTTMRMIVGLDHPSAGTVTVNGRPYGAIRRPLHEVGAVLERAPSTAGAARSITCSAWPRATEFPIARWSGAGSGRFGQGRGRRAGGFSSE